MAKDDLTWGYLGDIKFKLLSSPILFERDEGYKFAEHELIGTKPKLQNVGQELTTIYIEIEFNWSFCNPETRLIQIENVAKNQQPVNLQLQYGRNYRDFIIERLNIITKNTHMDGTIKLVNIAITLKEWIRSSSDEKKATNHHKKVKS